MIASREAHGQRVVFTGRRSRELLKLYYSAADALVTTPWYEPFGITPLEAMACGTPVIGSAVGGLQYSIEDGESGLLVPPHQPRQLGHRLAHFYANPRLAKRMSRSALRRVRALFTWERVARKLEAVYATVLEPDAISARTRVWTATPSAREVLVAGGVHGAALP
jgi:glycosyltransferase involved in cell wall biosynthesis